MQRAALAIFAAVAIALGLSHAGVAQVIHVGPNFYGVITPTPTASPTPTPTPTGTPTPTPSPTPTATPTPQSPEAVIDALPSVYLKYAMCETSGTSAADGTGNGHTGTYVAPIGYATPDPYASTCAAAFVGTGTGSANSQLTSSIAGSSTIWTNPFTVGFFYDGTSWPGFGNQWIAGTGPAENGSGGYWDFIYGNGNAGYTLYWGYGGTGEQLTYTHAVLTGWHLFTITVSGTTATIYVDGSSVASKTIASGFVRGSGAGTFTLGNNVAYDGNAWQCACSMSYAFLATNAMTSGAVSTLYTNLAVPTPTPSPTPIGPPLAGPAAGETIAQAVCVNNAVMANVEPTSGPGGAYAGDFTAAGLTTANVLGGFWDQNSTRNGDVGSSTVSRTTITSAITIPAAGGSVSVNVASGSGITNGSQVEVGYSAWQNGEVYAASVTDPETIIGTVASGGGTTTLNLTNVYPLTQTVPPTLGTTIAHISPAYGTATKVYSITPATWLPFQESFGAINGAYESQNITPGDATGLTIPMIVANDTAISGSPQGLAITPALIPAGDQWPNESASTVQPYPATSVHTANTWPSAGGSITLSVTDVSQVHNDDTYMIGTVGNNPAIVFVASGGCDNLANTCPTAGVGNIVVVDAQYPESVHTGTLAVSTVVQRYGYNAVYSAELDREFPIQYGYVSSTVRQPPAAEPNSAAAWVFQTQAGAFTAAQAGTGPARNECDYGEQFANELGNGENAGCLLYVNSGGIVIGEGQGSSTTTGAYAWPGSPAVGNGTNPSGAYNQFGQLYLSGGAAFPTPSPYYPPPACCGAGNGTVSGETLVLNGQPQAGHMGMPDLTQGVASKEVIDVYQVAFPGSGEDATPTATGAHTTSSFVIPSSAYASTVTIPISSLSGWTAVLGREVDIADGTHYMHGMVVSVNTGTPSLTVYPMAETVSPNPYSGTSYGATMATSATVYAADAAQVSGQLGTYWIQNLFVYAPNGQSC